MAAMVSSMYFGLGAGEFPESWSSSSRIASRLPSSGDAFSLDLSGLAGDDSDNSASPKVSGDPRTCCVLAPAAAQA